jgi:apolipoprotein D and lipocalin family protein
MAMSAKRMMLLMALFTGLLACGSKIPLDTVANVDLSKYAGTWHEIASYPSSFQKGCNCTTATYTVMDGQVKVENRCYRDGKWDGITGKAFTVEGFGNARLKVQFFWPFRGDYYIMELADDYSHALVGHPNRDYLWVLSRTPEMDPDIYARLLAKATKARFDTSRLVRTPRVCNAAS